MRARLIAVFVAFLFALGFAAAPAAQASTGGTPDGDLHPNVGLILFYTEDGRFRCSATLVSPTVVLAAAGYLSGEAHTHPDYSDFTDLDNWYDVGVVVLDEPVTDIQPATIAEVGTSDAIRPSQLRSTLFTAVGYGTEVRKAESGPQNPQPMSYPLLRRYVEMPGQKVTPQIIQTNGNEKDPFGTGGTCFGDSGGPLFLGDVIVGVTSYGYTSNCRYIDGYQRVDITGVADWLAGFGV